MRALTSGVFAFVSFALVACSGEERGTATTDFGSAPHSIPEISADRIEARAVAVFRESLLRATTPVSIPGINLRALTSGDFDGDGVLDLAAAGDGTVQPVFILLGAGDGTFLSPLTTPTIDNGVIAQSIAASDFNHDEQLDLLVLYFGTGNVALLLGNGDGTFQRPNYTGTNIDHPGSMIVAELDGDDDLDVAFGAETPPFAGSTLPGRGDGRFLPGDILLAGDPPNRITSGDFNGDGHVDLVFANRGSNDVTVLLGCGDGTFNRRSDFPVGLAPSGVIAQDFNGDDQLDLALASEASGVVSILLGGGDGRFVSEVGYEAGDAPSVMTAADLDSDGDLDLVIGDRANGDIIVRLNDGDGGFPDALQATSRTNPIAIIAGDFNGDGRSDVAVAHALSSELTILLNTGHL